MKLHLGCGPLRLDGWENVDYPEVDATKPLPYADASVDFVFTEHMLEHLSIQHAWGFLAECHRVLRPGGVVRTTVPSIVKLWRHRTPEYIQILQSRGWGDGSDASSIKHVVFMHNHVSLWTPELLVTISEAIGFKAYEVALYQSTYEELKNIESHGKSTSKFENDLESVSVESVKA